MVKLKQQGDVQKLSFDVVIIGGQDKIKVIVRNTDGLIVGVAILSSVADQLINQFRELIDQQVSSEALLKRIYADPTPESDLNYLYH